MCISPLLAAIQACAPTARAPQLHIIVAVPWGKGSRPTPRLQLDSTCPALNSGTPLPGHMVRLGTRTEPRLCSEGRRRGHPGSSSRTFGSACYSCSPEGSSARGQHSKPPGGEKKKKNPECKTQRDAEFLWFKIDITAMQ